MTELQIQVDEDLCIGSAECMAVAPNAFLLGPSDMTVRILPEATGVPVEVLEDAAMSCPTGAIRISSAG